MAHLMFRSSFSILSFWVTIIAMADLPYKIQSLVHILGCIGIALGVEYDKTGLWTFVVPAITAVVILGASWGFRYVLCKQSLVCCFTALCAASSVPQVVQNENGGATEAILVGPFLAWILFRHSRTDLIRGCGMYPYPVLENFPCWNAALVFLVGNEAEL